MRVVYAESSAVLAWLLGEPRHQVVIEALGRADRVVTSTLTAIECRRALARAPRLGRVSVTDQVAARRALEEALPGWNLMDLTEEVAVRAAEPFPREPVRTLDAVHLATAQLFLEALGAVEMLSLDGRVRENARALGMSLAPHQ